MKDFTPSIRGRLARAGFFLAITIPLGALIHVAAEAAALDGAFAWTRHLYLIGLSAAALAYIVWYAVSLEPSERRRRIALLTSSLPGGGRGLPFALAAGCTQFAFIAATELFEGAPFASGNVALGLVCAVAATLACALLLSALRFRLIEGLVQLFDVVDPRPAASLPDKRASASLLPSRREPYFHCCWNRPPPVSLSTSR